jgi:AAA15 family ATPase/GTPase
MKSRPHLGFFQLKNFKAVRSSKMLGFPLLTAFIGKNGSAKSKISEIF